MSDPTPFVEVYAKATGVKQVIPRPWLEHPELGAPFELVPSARDTGSSEPDESWTRAQLSAYAEQVGLESIGTKSDLLAAIDRYRASATDPTDPTPDGADQASE